ncbi:uncharacterized protein LOC142568618 isoform X2 [Dermacentor variabilis]|uniref:uncharacterized protein LOC142568618 isoform X2 n=1 Tax=Dermacentor variabilis TaxID=34621 RepID=UPI003F5B6B04
MTNRPERKKRRGALTEGGDAGRVPGSDARRWSATGPGVEDGPLGSGPEPPGLNPTGASCQPVPPRRQSTRACRQLLKAGGLLCPWAGREQSGYGPEFYAQLPGQNAAPVCRAACCPRPAFELLCPWAGREQSGYGPEFYAQLPGQNAPAIYSCRLAAYLLSPSQSWRASVARSTILYPDLWERIDVGAPVV